MTHCIFLGPVVIRCVSGMLGKDVQPFCKTFHNTRGNCEHSTGSQGGFSTPGGTSPSPLSLLGLTLYARNG